MLSDKHNTKKLFDEAKGQYGSIMMILFPFEKTSWNSIKKRAIALFLMPYFFIRLALRDGWKIRSGCRPPPYARPQWDNPPYRSPDY